jgi:hypothetical protein
MHPPSPPVFGLQHPAALASQLVGMTDILGRAEKRPDLERHTESYPVQSTNAKPHKFAGDSAFCQLRMPTIGALTSIDNVSKV